MKPYTTDQPQLCGECHTETKAAGTMTPSLLLVVTSAAMYKMMFSVCAIEYHLVAIQSLGWEWQGGGAETLGKNKRGKFHKCQRKIHI